MMSIKLPTIICSSVIRSTKQGESHGGIYLVDLETSKVKQVIDWNDETISWEGRGADRGLRGIAFYSGNIYFAASDEIFVYDKKFQLLNSFTNKYLKHCHEIVIKDNLLYLTSTGYDSILEFNLDENKFTKGFLYRKKVSDFKLVNSISKKLKINKYLANSIFNEYNPNEDGGPELMDSHHINNVSINEDEVLFSGTQIDALMGINKSSNLMLKLKIPYGTHNAQIYNNHLVYNDTQKDVIRYIDLSNDDSISLEMSKYDQEKLLYKNISKDHARQGFGRGLCFFDDYIIGGSSPSTISIYSITEKKLVKKINITMDVRNAIHGLEVYPYNFDIV